MKTRFFMPHLFSNTYFCTDRDRSGLYKSNFFSNPSLVSLFHSHDGIELFFTWFTVISINGFVKFHATTERAL